MDLYLFQQINQFAGKWVCLDSVAVFFARYFEYFLIFCLLLFLISRFKKYWKMVIWAFVSAVFARFVIVDFIRFLWYRPRPFIENKVNLLLDYPDKASFPSGHAAFYFGLSTIIYLHNKKLGLFFYGASFLICLARVFVGIHWPLDILAGALIGVLSGLTIYKISKISEK